MGMKKNSPVSAFKPHRPSAHLRSDVTMRPTSVCNPNNGSIGNLSSMSASDRRRTVHESQVHYAGGIDNMPIMREISAASLAASIDKPSKVPHNSVGSDYDNQVPPPSEEKDKD